MERRERVSSIVLNVHELLSLRGLTDARALAATKTERAAVEAAAYVQAHPLEHSTAVHVSLLATSLPHRSLDPTADWRRQSDQMVLSFESGVDDEGALIGIPYGSQARMILFYLQDQAVRGGGREVALGPTMHAWLRSMKRSSAGGMTYRVVGEQARRIATCRYSLISPTGRNEQGAFVERLLREDANADDKHCTKDPKRRSFTTAVLLDQRFYSEAVASRIRVSQAALRCLSNNSVALDVYVRQAAYLPLLSAPETISWKDIAPNFGAGYREPRRMRTALLRGMQMALAVYPEAKIDILSEGLRMYPSPPPISSDVPILDKRSPRS